MKFVTIKKSAAVFAAALLAAIGAGMYSVKSARAASLYLGYASRELPVYCVDTPEKKVALTFDAAWGADKTLGILSVLEQFDARATFFVVGFWAEKYGEELKRLYGSGRVEIGTHSNTHAHMTKLTPSQTELELTASSKIIEDITGKKPDLFRCPFGEYSDGVLNTAERIGLQTVQWDVDSLDWKDTPADAMAVRILKRVKPGSIILMHNDGKYTLQALPLIIQGLRNRGYDFVTAGELLYKDNYKIDRTGKQIRT